jgi:hypothetical protein
MNSKPRYTVTVVVEVDDLETASAITKFMEDNTAILTRSVPATVHVGDPHAVRTKMSKLEYYVWLYHSQAIDKYEFHDAVKHYSAQRVAEASGLDIEVVRMRRRDLRKMAA